MSYVKCVANINLFSAITVNRNLFKIIIITFSSFFRYDVDETSPDKSDNEAYEIMSKSML